MENHREWIIMTLVSLHIRFADTLTGPDVGVCESYNANIQTRCCWLWFQCGHLVSVCSHFPKTSARYICRTQPTHGMVFIASNCARGNTVKYFSCMSKLLNDMMSYLL